MLQAHGFHSTAVQDKNDHFSAAPRDKFSHMKYWEHESSVNQNECGQLYAQDNISENYNKPPAEDSNGVDHSGKFWGEFSRYEINSENNYKKMEEIQSHLTENIEPPQELSHVNVKGEAQMVDVSAKDVSVRHAIARAEVYLGSKAFALVKENKVKKGDVLGVARIAGVMAAKKTSDLIPLCHPLPLDHIDISFDMQEEIQGEELFRVVIDAKATTSGRTGVEMEALTAATVAALTVYDMCKAVTHDITISNVCLMFKAGGKRDFSRKSHKFAC